MINNQEYITTKLKKMLEKMIILSAPRLNNLIVMVIGILCSQSVVLYKISQELKDNYFLGTEESKIKRFQRFLSNEAINPEKLYKFFTYKLLKKYKFIPKSIYIIFDHTTIDNRFVILQFSLKIGERAIPLWFKVFKYKQEGNKDFIHVKEGLTFLHKILTPYNFDVTILADRGFKSIDLFKFIDEGLKWKYCIRCTKDLSIFIDGKNKIKKLDDILPKKYGSKYFYNIKLTSRKYTCNMAVCKAIDTKDTWFIASNYAKMLYFCVCIAYTYIVSLGISCGKDKKQVIRFS